MTNRRRPQISLRKAPQQARSTDLVAAILQAAVQVLVKEGAPRFTTARVAEKAGVSVGSVYQYFPNKAAILFRLQADEWQQTTQMLCDILQDTGSAPLDRLRKLVHAFIQTEFDEAQVRMALDDAAPLYRDALEARQVDQGWEAVMRNFMAELLPSVDAATRDLAGELVMTTLGTVGEHLSRSQRSAEDIRRYGDAMADMFGAYLKLQKKKPTR
ncbi:TetR family transcriptional regulator [Herbaspirillum sp. YR522]|uniref:TetR family transcriptional regulator n=1 Tax=Herbaspirillum sp. YR522 TaxID=1144342 RepID=UPI00026F7616|nr:TetR family transcriptional regulator [Herbaspirillum sp. YR522]EJN09995.1 transcriptional regulator [Herbaspirillum sp. YR522]